MTAEALATLYLGCRFILSMQPVAPPRLVAYAQGELRWLRAVADVRPDLRELIADLEVLL